MGHSSKPKDSCGGTRGCGGNMLLVGVPQQRDSAVKRNLRALSDIVAAVKATRTR
ncbi:hypothetical protein AB0C21_12535 [Spirillospora sp. NPDC049024]